MFLPMQPLQIAESTIQFWAQSWNLSMPITAKCPVLTGLLNKLLCCTKWQRSVQQVKRCTRKDGLLGECAPTWRGWFTSSTNQRTGFVFWIDALNLTMYLKKIGNRKIYICGIHLYSHARLHMLKSPPVNMMISCFEIFGVFIQWPYVIATQKQCGFSHLIRSKYFITWIYRERMSTQPLFLPPWGPCHSVSSGNPYRFRCWVGCCWVAPLA